MKKESNHTPGPWHVAGRRNRGGEQIAEKIIFDQVEFDCGGMDWNPQGKANSNLLAAAFEMLAALELAKGEFERRDGAGTCPLEIEDAIAKARGGEE